MILALRITFIVVFLTMLTVTIWASRQVALWEIPASVGGHPWFIATLFDAYLAFLTFYLWVAYKETSNLARFLWLIGILTLGNFAMAAYLLKELLRLPLNAKLEELLLRRQAPH